MKQRYQQHEPVAGSNDGTYGDRPCSDNDVNRKGRSSNTATEKRRRQWERKKGAL